MMKTLSALDLRKKLGEVLDSVAQNNEQVIISRANKPLAVLISVDEFEEKIQKSKRGDKLKELSVRMDDWRMKHRQETKHLDVIRAVRETRDGR
jgi:prevent-host-death family protein